VTPGVGVRVTTPLGPVRVDVAYNGYDPESGTLLLQNDSVLVEYRPSYRRHRPPYPAAAAAQFAIGQAF
jgi:outer membrane protein assembly factor BamA